MMPAQKVVYTMPETTISFRSFSSHSVGIEAIACYCRGSGEGVTIHWTGPLQWITGLTFYPQNGTNKPQLSPLLVSACMCINGLFLQASPSNSLKQSGLGLSYFFSKKPVAKGDN